MNIELKHKTYRRLLETSLMLLATAFTGCDDRLEAVKELGARPSILLESVRTGLQAKLLVDTAKLSYNISSNYPFAIQIDDPFGNISELSMDCIQGTGELYYEDELITGKVPVLGNKSYFKFLPKQLGNVWVSFIVTGQQNKKDTAMIKLTIIDNLPPIANIIATPDKTDDPYGYVFDASSSYDADRSAGGRIVKYIFNIAGRKIETYTPVVKHIFPMPGTYTIKLQVMDNDDALSEEITKTITVQ